MCPPGTYCCPPVGRLELRTLRYAKLLNPKEEEIISQDPQLTGSKAEIDHPRMNLGPAK